jgi:hypothetical protein
LGGRGRRISEFKASLVYRVSFRTVKATHLGLKKKNQRTKKLIIIILKDICSVSFGN